MTTFFLKYLLIKEINQLNRLIDEKIFQGQSYLKEAKLHKQLLSKLENLDRGFRFSFFL